MKSKLLAMIYSQSSAEKSKYHELPLNGEDTNIRNRFQNSRHPVIFSILYLLLGLSLGLGVGFSVRTNSPKDCWIPKPVSPIPHEVIENRISKVFNPDERYVGPSKEVDENWLKLVDSDAVWIGKPDKYGLGKGMKAPPQYSQPKEQESQSENFYFVSNMHQVHCLDIIRRRYWYLMKEGYDPSAPDAEDWGTHVDHCIEYLRLGVTCGDFLIVEPDSPPGTPYELTVDGLGWGVTHSCIDFDRLLQFQKDQEVLYNQSLQA